MGLQDFVLELERFAELERSVKLGDFEEIEDFEELESLADLVGGNSVQLVSWMAPDLKLQPCWPVECW